MTALLQTESFYVNCMPAVPPDPVIGGFEVEYDNTAGITDGLATINTAALEFTDPSGLQLLWSMAVDPLDSGTIPAGTSSVVPHAKTGGFGAGQPCDFCSGTWELQLTWDIGGTPASDTLPLGSVYCVY